MAEVKVSDVQLIPVKPKEGLTFFASCILDDKYYLGNLAVFSLRDGSGFRVVFPTKTLKNGQQIPIFYPVKKELADEIQRAISRCAEEFMGEVSGRERRDQDTQPEHAE